MLCWDSSTVLLTTAGEGQNGRCWTCGLCVGIASLISPSPSVAMSTLSGWGEATLKTWWCWSRISSFGDWALECSRQYWKQKQLSSLWLGWGTDICGHPQRPKNKMIFCCCCKSPWSRMSVRSINLLDQGLQHQLWNVFRHSQGPVCDVFRHSQGPVCDVFRHSQGPVCDVFRHSLGPVSYVFRHSHWGLLMFSDTLTRAC